MPEASACPSCGALNLAGQRFCGTCGSGLAEAPPETAAATELDVAPAAVDERRWVTVLFADIAGFTSMSEKLDFEEVRDIADRCAEVMGEQARRFGGTVLNVMGDAIMAVFGAPAAHDDDPERAVRAALAMVAAIPKSTPPELNLALHVGVNTGEVMAGLLGPAGRRDYTVMGDTINTGARLEAAAVRGEVVVGRETYLATRNAIRYEVHEPVSAKGKQDKVEAWLAVEPLAVRVERSTTSAPLVGREREMEQLMGLWRSTVEEPRAHLVTLIAPPGVGKSRLGREFAATAEAGGALVLNGRSLPYGESTGYRPFAEQVRAAAGLTVEMTAADVADTLADHVRTLFAVDQPEIVSNLMVMLGLGGDEVAPERQVLFYSARRWLGALARRAPTLLVFEDAHWADATLLELIGSVASRAGETPLLLLCLARPGLLEEHPEWGAGQAAYSAITLDSLSPEASRRLTEVLLAGADAGAVDRLVEASGGNPLFVEELVAAFSERDGNAPAQLPSSVKAIIGARLDLLDDRERDLLLNAAVVGDVFWRGAVAALGGGDTDYLLEELQGRGLVRREAASTVPGDQQFVFKHALIREVAYGRLPRRSRRERHATVAAYLEQVLGAQKDEMASLLAHHWAEADEGTTAARYFTLAADRAANAWAKKEAIGMYTRAIDLLRAKEEAAGVDVLLVRRARAYAGTGDLGRAAADLDAALRSLTGEARARALLDRSRVAFSAVDADGVVRFAGEAADAAALLQDRFIEASAWQVQSGASLMGGRLGEAIELGTRSVEGWPERDRANDSDYANALSMLALYHYWRGDYERAEELGRRAVDLALAVQALEAGAQGTAHLAMALAGLGRQTEALEWFDRSVNIGLEWEALPRYSGRSMNMWAGSVREMMDFKQARELSERGLEMGRRAQFPPAIQSAGIDLFLLDVAEDRLGEAKAALPALWEVSHQTKGFHRLLFEIRMADGNAALALATGRPEEGIEQARAAIEQAAKLPRKKYLALASANLALCLLGAGRAPEAVEVAVRAAETAAGLRHPQSVWRTSDALSLARAATGDDDGAQRAADQAADEVTRFGESVDRAGADLFFAAHEVSQILKRAGRTSGL